MPASDPTDTADTTDNTCNMDSADTTGDYDPSYFPPFAVTADLVILTVRPPKVEVLLVRRAQPPFAQQWALPGGFVGPDQSLVEAARFKLQDKTGIDVEAVHLEQLASFGDPERDPRMRVVSVAWLAMVAEPGAPTPGAGTLEAAWVDVDDAADAALAFDHGDILRAGIERARNRIEYTTLATTFCGESFTIGELRAVYETLWGQPLDPANFSRKVLATDGFVEATGQVVPQAKGRPARTYRSGSATTLVPPLQR